MTRSEDEEKANYGVDDLRAEFRERLYGPVETKVNGTTECPICYLDVPHTHDETTVSAWRWAQTATSKELHMALANRNWYEGEQRAWQAGRQLLSRLHLQSIETAANRRLFEAAIADKDGEIARLRAEVDRLRRSAEGGK